MNNLEKLVAKAIAYMDAGSGNEYDFLEEEGIDGCAALGYVTLFEKELADFEFESPALLITTISDLALDCLAEYIIKMSEYQIR